MSDWGNPEKDRILVPAENDEYKAYPLLRLLGINDRKLRGVSNFGMAPVRFITQRGPQQDGESPLDYRLDPRTIQIVVAHKFIDRTTFWDARNDLLDTARPSRSFNGSIRPLIYRKALPAGAIEGGSDGVSDGSNTFTSKWGRFITRGALGAGDSITIAGTPYIITGVPNDYTLTLAAGPGAATGLGWTYRRRHAIRDLYCLLERGPSFDEFDGPQPFYPTGFIEALRFVAHDPVWYGPEQTETWELPESVGDLVFDGFGAWFGETHGVGRWVFDTTSTSQTTNIIYWGTDPAIPTIEVTGPCDTFSISNSATGSEIQYNNTIAAGVTVTINLLSMTVTDNLGNRLFSYASGDMSNFKLVPSPQGSKPDQFSPGRENPISVNFTGSDANTLVAITWKNRFIGI